MSAAVKVVLVAACALIDADHRVLLGERPQAKGMFQRGLEVDADPI